MRRTTSIHHLDAEGLTSRADNLALDVGLAKQRILVRDLAGAKVALGGGVLAAAVGHVGHGGVAVLLGVRGEDDLLLARVLEHGGLDADLGAHAGVDARAAELVVEVVVDVDGAVADRGVARVDVVPVVVGVGDVELALVASVRVDVADQGGLEVVVDVAVGDGDEVGLPGDVQEAPELRSELRSTWSTQTLVDDSMPMASPLVSLTLEMARLRTMTFLTPLMYRPTPVSLEPFWPMMVLSDPTRTLSLPEIEPLTTMLSLPSDSAALVNCASVDTVVVAPPLPPVVPPLVLA